MRVPVVENAGKKKKGRYGGALVRVGSGRARFIPVRKSRNPDLLALSGNKGKQKKRPPSRPRYAVRHVVSRRNPGFLSGLGRMFDVNSIVGVGVGIWADRNVPALVQQRLYAGLPTSGVLGFVVRLGLIYGTSEAARMLLRSPNLARNIMTGGMASVAAALLTEGMKAAGLSGLTQDDLYADELLRAVEGVDGYVYGENQPPVAGLPALAGYVQNGRVDYASVV